MFGDREHLLERGYGEELWQKDLTMVVAIDDKKNILENFKAQLRFNLIGLGLVRGSG